MYAYGGAPKKRGKSRAARREAAHPPGGPPGLQQPGYEIDDDGNPIGPEVFTREHRYRPDRYEATDYEVDDPVPLSRARPAFHVDDDEPDAFDAIEEDARINANMERAFANDDEPDALDAIADDARYAVNYEDAPEMPAPADVRWVPPAVVRAQPAFHVADPDAEARIDANMERAFANNEDVVDYDDFVGPERVEPEYGSENDEPYEPPLPPLPPPRSQGPLPPTPWDPTRIMPWAIPRELPPTPQPRSQPPPPAKDPDVEAQDVIRAEEKYGTPPPPPVAEQDPNDYTYEDLFGDEPAIGDEKGPAPNFAVPVPAEPPAGRPRFAPGITSRVVDPYEGLSRRRDRGAVVDPDAGLHKQVDENGDPLPSAFTQAEGAAKMSPDAYASAILKAVNKMAHPGSQAARDADALEKLPYEEFVKRYYVPAKSKKGPSETHLFDRPVQVTHGDPEYMVAAAGRQTYLTPMPAKPKAPPVKRKMKKHCGQCGKGGEMYIETKPHPREPRMRYAL